MSDTEEIEKNCYSALVFVESEFKNLKTQLKNSGHLSSMLAYFFDQVEVLLTLKHLLRKSSLKRSNTFSHWEETQGFEETIPSIIHENPDEVKSKLKLKEKALNDAVSQIQSMKAALSYQESFYKVKEANLSNELEKMKEKYDEYREIKRERDKYLKKVQSQTNIIEKLSVKVDRVHKSYLYYKEETKRLDKTIEDLESKLSSEIDKKRKLQSQFQAVKQELQEIKQQVFPIKEETNSLKEALTTDIKDLIVKADYFHINAMNQIRQEHEMTLNQIILSFNERIEEYEQKHQETYKNLNSYCKDRTEEIKKFYESRIQKMIENYSSQESNFHSKVTKLNNLYQNSLSKSHKLKAKLNTYDYKLKNTTDSFEIASRRANQLEKLYNRTSLELQKSKVGNKVELDFARKELQNTREDFEFKQNLQRRSLKLMKESLAETNRGKYEEQLNRVKDDYKFRLSKLKVKKRTQKEAFLSEITRLNQTVHSHVALESNN